ncbi:cytochrome c [Magnetovibrio sp. PR-2]|uniref:c-type cytochrome n=1 Tax=Magnetovibrio sp. PR-2 TaxID=3120356 RepID=UPI002FCE2A0C
MSAPEPQPTDTEGLHPEAPRQGSPWKWMLLMMAVLVVLTTYSMWGKEKISIKANVVVPELTPLQQAGRADFAKLCQDCHGADGSGGSRKGQPLIHPMYRENVFPDYVFKKALRDGKREKNWRFGEMPPTKGITEPQIDNIVSFVRAVQNASGID